MSYTALIYLILSFGPYSRKKKILYALGAMLCLIGMGSSGSRGPVFVVFVGVLCYLFLARNFRILVPGLGAILIVFAFLKFTYIGNANYQIYRIRTAIDPKEASLLVRLANQAKLRTYLVGKPFGAGIGTTDVWARRYYPGSYLASLPTDSWFVKIWAENGVVGLSIYALTLAWAIVMGVVNIRKLKNKDTRQKIIALYGGFLGILAASFGNPVFGQAPLGALMYISMAILSTATLFDEPENALSPI
jgi:cell division protein FtsW (lipid II flippase)